MSTRRMGKRFRVVISALTMVSLGMRTSRLSKVRSLVDKRSMDNTSPVVDSTRITSPTATARSNTRKSPLITLETDV